jgi:hypothetical protein
MRECRDFPKNIFRFVVLNANGTDARIAPVPSFKNKTDFVANLLSGRAGGSFQ